MPNPVIEHVYVDNVTYDVKDIYAERKENKVSSFAENETNDRYPSALLVKSLLDQKAEKGALVTSFDSVPSDSKYPSEKAVKDALDLKENASNKVSVFQDTPTHGAYPTEKLVKDSLDLKENLENKTTEFASVPNNTRYPTEKLVYDSLQAQRTIVVNALPEVANAVETCDYILKNGNAGVLYKVIDGAWAPVGASNAKVLEELPASGDVYTDYYVANAEGVYLHYRWDGTEFYEVGSDAYSKAQADDLLDEKEDVANKVTAFQQTPTDIAYPSEKLVFDSLSSLQSTLEGKVNSSTTVVNELPEVATADSNKNYVLMQGSGALLYRVINGAWKMIGGAMVSVVDELPATGDAFTDYYVATENDEIYLHYRWVDEYEDDGETVAAHFYAVGADAYSKAEVDSMFEADRARLTAVEGSASTLAGNINTINAQLTTIENMVDNVAAPQDGSGGIVVTYKNGTTATVDTYDKRKRVEEVQKSSNGIEIFYTDGTSEEIEIKGGGGGGASDTGSATITRVTAADATCVYGEPFDLQYRFEATDSAGDQVGSGNATWYVGNVRVATSTALQNVINSFDIGPYLTVGSNAIRISVSVDTGGDTPIVRTKTWTINCVNMYVEWDYDETTINTADQVTIRWTPYGNVSKTTYIIIDGNTASPITSTTARSGVQQYVTINKLAHGSHHVVMYCQATINGVTITSLSVEHDMIFADTDSVVPVIACSVDTADVVQYNTIALPVVIYTPGSLTSDATLAVDGTVTAEWTNVDRTVHVWNYTPSADGRKTLTITSGSVTKTITINVTKLDIDNEEVGGYSFRLKASELAGNDALRSWNSNGVNATFSSNFDWSNGGIKSETDANGNLQQYICVKTGTRMTLNYKMFADDAVVNGKTFKIIFKVTNCRDYDATIASCYSDGIGVQLSAHNASMSSSGTTVNVPYGEDDYLELEFDVYPAPKAENDGNFRYIMAWLDGVITSTRVYSASDNFTQTNQANIVIGSDDCDVYVYMVKEYPTLISRTNHIENFIADAPNAQEMVKRYNRNNILDITGDIDYNLLAEQNPDCRVWLYDIPYLTNGKKDKVSGCKFQQIWKNGKKYYSLTGTGTMTVQGTSSVKYIQGAANTDINFKVLEDGDGNNLLANGTEDEAYGNNWYVEDEENPGHAKVFEVAEGDELGPECIAVERDSNRNITKYIKALGFKINDDSCPITYSNTKVNFASCEQVNNMCNAIWYQRYNPYPSLTPHDCMEFSMGVQFIKDSGEVPDDSHFVLWGDNKYHMYSIANMGNSKKNVHVFHDLSNPTEVCIEVNDNNAEQMRMVNDDLSAEDWSGDVYFGMRYPDTKNPSQEIKDAWQRLVTWFATNNPNAATGNALPRAETYENYTFRGHDRPGTQVLRGTTVKKYAGTYTNDTFERRMAKMLSECEDYMVMDSFIYHFVYLERHTMVDNVSKNNFWSSTDLIHWDLSKAYDMDTSDGNNNQGQMVFDYGNEYDDAIGEKMVFNGGDSVWFVFCANLYEACQTMFTNREALGAWSATAYHNFLLSEQQKVPERVWVQCYWYDYLRTYEQGISGEWMTFLDGGQKSHQRKHFEYFEELYDSSKYRGSVSTTQNVNFRAYKPSAWAGVEPKSQITITMYNKMYISIESGTTAVDPIKAERGVPYVINFPVEVDVGGTQVAINTASMIQAISGMEQLYPDTCVFSNAIRLRALTIGSNATGYRNTFLTNLSLDNNRMLEYLYVQNLPNANTGLNLTNCASLKYLDASGSGFTSYDFAVGGVLATAYMEAPVSLSLRDLQYLLDANLHITDYTKLATLRLENCPGINSLQLVTNAVNLNRARILGVDWSMATTDTLNRMLAMIGMDANGYNTAVSVLSGDAYVSGTIRSVELENYADAWDSLDVTYNPDRLIVQYIITYKNWDGSVLLELPVDRGSYPPNPVLNGLIEEPTRPSDAQYVYTYSGWDSISTIVTDARDVIATYSTVGRTYTVTWYELPGDITPLATTSSTYGSAATFSGTLPTVKYNEDLGTYRVFTGWDKSTGFIREDTNVYGVWDSAYYPDESKELKDLTPAEMYALSIQEDVSKKGSARYSVKDYFDIQHGHDFNFSNVESEVVLENRFFDGTSYVESAVQPFKEAGKPFTIAIDYEFLVSCDSLGSLINCVNPVTSNGFSLEFTQNNDPSASFSTIKWSNGQARRVGLSAQRNIIVLRYGGGTNLQVYSFNGASSGSSGVQTYDDSIFYGTWTGSSTPAMDTKLTFGAIRYEENGYVYYSNYAKGWIHWAKIWYDDLGDENCRLLASWPHETTRMEYAGASRQIRAEYSGLSVDSSFFSNNLLPLMYAYSTNEFVTATWEGSKLQNFYENRIFKGLPFCWQSVIKQVRVVTANKYNADATITSYNHLYPPAYVEVDSGATSSQYLGENTKGFVSGLFGTSGLYVMTARWTGLVIEDRNSAVTGRRVITTADDPTSSTNGYVCEDGDIWIRSNPKWFIYISEETAAKHSIIGSRLLYVDDSSSIIRAQGGGYWIRNENWWTRSPDKDNSDQFRARYFWLDYFFSAAYSNQMGLMIGFSI